MCYRDYCFALERPIVHEMANVFGHYFGTVVCHGKIYGMSTSPIQKYKSQQRTDLYLLWFLYAEDEGFGYWQIGRQLARTNKNVPYHKKVKTMFYIIRIFHACYGGVIP